MVGTTNHAEAGMCAAHYMLDCCIGTLQQGNFTLNACTILIDEAPSCCAQGELDVENIFCAVCNNFESTDVSKECTKYLKVL